jgi:hypothetical protein
MTPERAPPLVRLLALIAWVALAYFIGRWTHSTGVFIGLLFAGTAVGFFFRQKRSMRKYR